MDFRDSPQDAAFRSEVRVFVDQKLPPALHGGPAFRAAFDAGLPHPTGPDWDAWRDAMRDRSWIAPHWPAEYGGGGLGVMQQFVLNEEFARERAPRFGGIGLGWAGPTILLYGDEEQNSATCPASSAARSNGARALASPAPDRTWPACRPAPSVMATTTSSTAPRSGPPARTRATG